MSRTANLLALSAVLALVSGPLRAQSTGSTGADAPGDDRFIYDQVDEGILRLDSRSGEVSLCSRQENQGWACRIVADERRAVDGEIGRLERENAEMRKLLAERGLNPPGSSVGAAPKASAAAQPDAKAVPESAAKPAEKAPEKAEVKSADKKAITARTIEVAETIWRRLVEMMTNVKADLQKRT